MTEKTEVEVVRQSFPNWCNMPMSGTYRKAICNVGHLIDKIKRRDTKSALVLDVQWEGCMTTRLCGFHSKTRFSDVLLYAIVVLVQGCAP